MAARGCQALVQRCYLPQPYAMSAPGHVWIRQVNEICCDCCCQRYDIWTRHAEAHGTAAFCVCDSDEHLPHALTAHPVRYHIHVTFPGKSRQ